MSSDLEKFLQQAAERLAQKAGNRQQGSRPSAGLGSPGLGSAGQASAGQGSSGGPRTQHGQPFAQSQGRRPAPVVEIIDAEVLEEEERRSRALRAAGPDPLSTIDTRPALAQSISLADERMGEHVQHMFGQELSHLATTASQPLMGSQQPNQTDQATEVISRKQFDNPLVVMLRSPDTLRAAFIISEIFRRPV